MTVMRERRPENVGGNLFVDESCIDCDTCRYMAPSTFSRIGDKSAVTSQPISVADKELAYQAMISCPTGSIRMNDPDPLVREVINRFPIAIDPIDLPGVYHLGYHDESTFAAAPYLIVRSPEEGNIMIDMPRFSSRLASKLEQLGGLRYIVLTHKDDVGGHDRWKQRFPDAVIARAAINRAIVASQFSQIPRDWVTAR